LAAFPNLSGGRQSGRMGALRKDRPLSADSAAARAYREIRPFAAPDR
jgi:hypothetical protein